MAISPGDKAAMKAWCDEAIFQLTTVKNTVTAIDGAVPARVITNFIRRVTALKATISGMSTHAIRPSDLAASSSASVPQKLSERNPLTYPGRYQRGSSSTSTPST